MAAFNQADPHLQVLQLATKEMRSKLQEEFKKVDSALSALTQNHSTKVLNLTLEQERFVKEQEQAIIQQKKASQVAFKQLEVEVNNLNDEKKTMEGIQNFQNSIVKLNVGGELFTTSRITLLSVDSSMLATMFSGRHTLTQTEDGSYFIDRDGQHFRHILNYLRNGIVVVDMETNVARELAVEAEYYGLRELAGVLRCPKIDINKCLGESIVKMRSVEAELRKPLSILKLVTTTNLEPYKGLVSVFEDDGALTQMNKKHSNDPMEFLQLLPKYGRLSPEKMKLPTTVPDFATFQSNFEQHFFEVRHEILTRLSPILREKKILIAGGAVLRALTGNSREIQTSRGDLLGKVGDIDVFICTQDAREATVIAERIFEALTANRDDYKVIRGAGVINIDVGRCDWNDFDVPELRDSASMTIQIVLRLYESPAEVLLGFDCDCCCLGFDGEHVWALPRAIRAIQYGCNILNPLHAWPSKASYEFRLVKYAIRGYAISVPGLREVDVDIEKIISKPLSELNGFARLIRLALAYDGFQTVNSGKNVDSLRSPVRLNVWRRRIGLILTGESRIGESHIGPIVRDLAETLKTALGPLEYARLASGWDYNDDGEMSNLLPSNIETFPTMNLKIAVSEGEGWAKISLCNTPELKIPAKLEDAWDASKRSREYLQINEGDLDSTYFAFAARDNSATTKTFSK